MNLHHVHTSQNQHDMDNDLHSIWTIKIEHHDTFLKYFELFPIQNAFQHISYIFVSYDNSLPLEQQKENQNTVFL